MKKYKVIIRLIIILLIIYGLVKCTMDPPCLGSKPVIYLYPTEEVVVDVNLEFNGDLFCTYPEYNNGWKVEAKPNGSLTNLSDGKEYSYLFWEGEYDNNWDIKEGFVVEGEKTAEFLQEKLSYMGLIPKEYNEFIVYWLPKMKDNKYNLIHFAKQKYEDLAKLEITPKPDSMLRIFMVYKPLNKHIDIKEQKLSKFKRTGFSVIEWGGTEIN